jgi:alkylated DNA repair dioxygenase AlkB
MDLFSNRMDETKNLLPKDGTVNYYGKVITQKEADHYFECLLNKISWKHDEAKIFGKHYITKRMVAWYGDDTYSYTYSNTTKQALIWTEELVALKALVEEKTGARYNSCLLNLYHNGTEGMAWHSDDEKSLGQNTSIASFSLGAERKFSFKHKETKETVSLILENGSLLMMKDATQTYWQHRLPPTKRVLKPRVNLTFRTIIL